ncbi:glycosyltransferase [Leeuwenhoekiella palythoae]|uniref:glycosyltransferase n=1 Tax=Leeuwenhoekiella palythoae TaxID=573501 RepID=UPI001CE104B2|nr:glycosyltransferase [Leeuwenhoekiella palythoae]UBZ09724.1 glycosyltransferase [Leeuwenhoekiella palythoae]
MLYSPTKRILINALHLKRKDTQTLKPKPQNICILVESLAGGGAERSAALLTQMLTEAGYAVHLVTITDKIGYEFSGRLYNLGKYKNGTNGIFNKLKRFQHFKKYLKEQNIDVILDFRMRRNALKEYCIQRYLYPGFKVVFMVRSSHLNYYFPKPDFVAKRLFKNAELCVLTEAMKQSIEQCFDFKKIKVLPNAIDVSAYQQEFALPKDMLWPYILASGRLQKGVKQFDKLIITYAKSELPKLGIDLYILGHGEMLEELQQLAEDLKIAEKVIFKGFVKHPEPYVAQALFTVMCSAFEGFPRVILESLACGTPVIAIDCPTGPRELLDGTNGILVPHQDFEALKEAMNRLALDEPTRNRFKAASQKSIRKFDITQVTPQWQSYLNALYDD